MTQKELVEQLRVVDSELVDVALAILNESTADPSLTPLFEEVLEFISQEAERKSLRFDLIQKVSARIRDKNVIKGLVAGLEKKNGNAPATPPVAGEAATSDDQVQIQEALGQLQQLQQTAPTSGPVMKAPVADTLAEVPVQPPVETPAAPVAPVVSAEEIVIPEMPPLPVAEPVVPVAETPVSDVPAAPDANVPATTP